MIHPISVNNPIYFRNKSKAQPIKQASSDENPISRKGEVMKLITGTFLGGLAFAGKLIWELAENGDFVLESFAKKAEKSCKRKRRAG